MTERSTMKSYAKVISIAYGVSASVDFKDSANNAIECNYISVDCRTGAAVTDDGYYIVQPSGVYGVEIDGIDGATAAYATGHHATAGMGGVIGTPDGGVEMSLASTDKTLGVTIFNRCVGSTASFGVEHTLNPIIFVITYGNMKQANPRRDQDNIFYPPGT